MTEFDQLVGKTIETVETDVYRMKIVVGFTDGTRATFRPGRDNIHNDFWSTVYVILEGPDNG